MQTDRTKIMPKTTKSRRDPAIELARVIACFIVVAFHVVHRHTNVKTVSFGMICAESLFTDGVSLFWMITGAFVFKQSNYPRLLKRTLSGIVVPLFVTSMIYYALDGILFNNMTLFESTMVPFKEWRSVLQGIAEWRVFAPNTTHLWYLFVYSIAMVLIPIVRPFVMYLNESRKRQIVFCVSTTILMLWNNATYDKLFGFTEPVNSQVVYALIYLIWGHVLYSNRQTITASHKMRWCAVAILAFIMINVIRSLSQFIRLGFTPNDYSYLHWFSGYSLLCASSILIFCLAVTKPDGDSPLKRMVCRLASYTFLIYLVHYDLKTYLLLSGVWTSVRHFFHNISRGGLGEIIFVLAYATALFVLSLAISVILKIVHRKLKPFFRTIFRT